eukprot:TRINITY_DN9835_c0_g1_i2.p1 TRINITY_DN9835_c0_g1~~TRINITY_DN9835_c0_g1_i2.p1  ORF type:complete len:205 (-),score=47.65 TRINITY_DN9835_c0_g1_i2:91-705(-)
MDQDELKPKHRLLASEYSEGAKKLIEYVTGRLTRLTQEQDMLKHQNADLLIECESMSSTIVDIVDSVQKKLRTTKPEYAKVLDYFRERNAELRCVLELAQQTSGYMIPDIFSSPRKSLIVNFLKSMKEIEGSTGQATGLQVGEPSPIERKPTTFMKLNSCDKFPWFETIASEKSSLMNDLGDTLSGEDMLQLLFTQAKTLEPYL